MLRTTDLEYELPDELIAKTPAEPRDSARIMVVRRGDPKFLEHARVRDLPRFLRAGDLLIMNSTRVLPARFEGVRLDTGGRVQGLWLESIPTAGERRWVVMLRGRRMKEGVTVGVGEASAIKLHLIAKRPDEPGAWDVRVEGAGAEETDRAVLERIGLTPLPPYILQARKHSGMIVEDGYDRAHYQTTFAHDDAAAVERGSVAAPTAGLHLTPELLAVLREQGVGEAEVALQVGLGTFKAVETEFVEQHPMHAEWCRMDAAARLSAQRTRAAGGRTICVGTTATRTVESFAEVVAAGREVPEWLSTRMLITPGYSWRWTDGMLTNFHLPRTTLLAMVAAMLEGAGGVERVKEVYAEAVRERYRFFSYGDAMLILP